MDIQNTLGGQPRANVSIVIPCYNGAMVIGNQIHALAGQLFPGDEIVVADNRSVDGSADVVRKLAQELNPAEIRVVDASAVQGINHARNIGVRAARNEHIILCDVDDVVESGWLAALADALDAGAPAVGGQMERVDEAGNRIEMSRGVYSYFWPGRGQYISTATGANCGFTSTLFLAVGGFDESFLGGSDEIDFFYRASLLGFRPRSVPQARVRYVQRDGIVNIWKQHVSYGRGSVALHRKLAHEGMPRDPWWHPLATVVLSAFKLLSPSPVSRRIGLERIARRVGRVQGSRQMGHLYL
ncbi:glycosyltransferase family 2 protein [Arthrobacter sp. PAMC 25486]|uniref:glycosyltransferase n=1 Tax=Arthrobacter sp. PAMC 25486 TaxID=1494608 RepID=UPI0012FF1C26|nr:glycosyltransferase [Arthrobacter sp. PAMC 25486]